jgi:hypothetical protein
LVLERYWKAEEKQSEWGAEAFKRTKSVAVI